MEGEQCFLRFRTVFEQHVLSRLDLRSLMSLSVTCRGLHCWVCSLPRTFWQDTQDLGVASGHAATLQSSATIMEALQAACLLRRGILEGHTATQQPAESLLDLPKDHAPPELFLSPDLRWCAISCLGRFTCAGAEDCRVYLYDAQTGKHQQTLHQGDTGGHIIRWTPCSRYLLMLLGVHEYFTQSLLVGEAATGSCTTPAWTSEAAAALQGDFYDENTEREMMFSPDGRLLLCWQGSWGPEQSMTLVVLDIKTGSIAAASALLQVPSKWHASVQYADAVRLLWHPSSRGLVIPGSLYDLADAQKLKSAGFAVGYCPLPAHLGAHSAFNQSGDKLLTSPPNMGTGPGVALRGEMPQAIMQVVEHEQVYQFTMLHVVEDPSACVPRGCWCPHGLLGEDALLLDNGRGIRLVSPHGQPQGGATLPDYRLSKCCWPRQPVFSPCGQYCQVFSIQNNVHTPCLLHCLSGKVYKLPTPALNNGEQELFWLACGSRLVLSTVKSQEPSLVQQPHSPFTVLTFPSS